MGTIVGIRVAEGVVLAGDRRTMDGPVVRSDADQRVFDYGEVGVAAIGEPGAVDEFDRLVEAEFRTEGLEEELTITKAARIAASVAETANVDAVVGAHDDEAVAHLREVRRDGSTLETELTAMGSGAEIALGRLEGAAGDLDLDGAESLVREAFEAVAERDAETGEEIDVWRLASN